MAAKTDSSVNLRQVKDLDTILRAGIPGYDPYVGAEDYYLDIDAVKLHIDFFEECLHHVKGSQFAGKAFRLENWEKAIVGNAFGWKHKKTKLRRYREVFIFVARKNGKTSLAAGLCLDGLFCDNELAAEIYGVAGEKEQARIVFECGKEMIKLEPELSRRSHSYKDSIVVGETSSFFKPLSKVSETKYGYNVHRCVVDELHIITDREVVDTMVTGTAARSQPMIIYITTAGIGVQSICREKYDYAKKILDGTINDSGFLPVVYEAAPDDDWGSEGTWRKANPNLGVSIPLDYLQREYEKAVQQPVYENIFRRLHLNQWTTSESRWIGAEDWKACGDDIDIEELKGRDCFGGLDLSTAKDLSAFALLFPRDDRIDLLVWSFAPKECIQERSRRDKVSYELWDRQGFIETTRGRVIDYDYVRKRILELSETFHIVDIGVDRWNASQLIGQLQGDGLNVVAFGQGFKDMAAPSKMFEELILGKRLRHNNNPVLRWAVGNTMVEIDAAGNIKPSKKKSTERIDPVVAIIMALGRWMASGTVVNADGNLMKVGI
ncbi:MAG: terminase TerL endonuclease subunit [Phycisphaerae bacterium]|jgi:phage terminase large subunit-like protein